MKIKQFGYFYRKQTENLNIHKQRVKMFKNNEPNLL